SRRGGSSRRSRSGNPARASRTRRLRSQLRAQKWKAPARTRRERREPGRVSRISELFGRSLAVFGGLRSILPRLGDKGLGSLLVLSRHLNEHIMRAGERVEPAHDRLHPVRFKNSYDQFGFHLGTEAGRLKDR